MKALPREGGQAEVHPSKRVARGMGTARAWTAAIVVGAGIGAAALAVGARRGETPQSFEASAPSSSATASAAPTTAGTLEPPLSSTGGVEPAVTARIDDADRTTATTPLPLTRPNMKQGIRSGRVTPSSASAPADAEPSSKPRSTVDPDDPALDSR